MNNLKEKYKTLLNKSFGLADEAKSKNTKILVDTSYVLYLTMSNAYNYVKKELGLEDDYTFDITSIADFRAAFEKRFEDAIFYTAKAGLNGAPPKLSNVIFAIDCSKKDIWRNKIYPEYKLQRKLKDKTKNPYDMAKAFNFAMSHIIPKFIDDHAGAMQIAIPTAEGDDIIACAVKALDENINKVIITSDRDYMQLLDKPNITLITCQGKILSIEDASNHKLLIESNKVLTPKELLLKKILMGDVADNIKSVKPRFGEVSVIKALLNKTELKKLLSDSSVIEQFELNSKLIDFDNIPTEIYNQVAEIIQS